eukprot:gene16247-biopygen13795
MTATIQDTSNWNVNNSQSWAPGGIKYIHSRNFFGASLARLAKNLEDDQLSSVMKYVEQRISSSTTPVIIQGNHDGYDGFPSNADKMQHLNLYNGHDYRDWAPPDTPMLTEEEREQVKEGFTLLKKKAAYPYDWVSDASKLNETQLPEKERFYNKLNDEHISDEDYQHAKKVWNFFGCQTFKDYHELHLIRDVLLLTDVSETIRKLGMEYYGLDPCHYISLPALAWDAMLKMTGVTPELLIEELKDICLKEYIDFNTIKRTNAKNNFEKDFFKLMSNAVFGKMVKNVRNHKKYDVCTDGVHLRKWVQLPQYYDFFETNENTLLTADRKKKVVFLNKPIYVCFSILNNTKKLMHDFHYSYTKPAFLEVRLCYMDTDSSIYSVPESLAKVHQVMKEGSDLFDFSNYSKERPNYFTVNKKVIGKMKDELGGPAVAELCSKMHSCSISDGHQKLFV